MDNSAFNFSTDRTQTVADGSLHCMSTQAGKRKPFLFVEVLEVKLIAATQKADILYLSGRLGCCRHGLKFSTTSSSAFLTSYLGSGPRSGLDKVSRASERPLVDT